MKKFNIVLIVFFGILIISMIANVNFGAVKISPLLIFQEIWNIVLGNGERVLSVAQNTIIMEIRLPHTILIALVGSALSVSGAAYQGLLKNPLADPFLIGVASGAGFGAVAGMFIKANMTEISFGNYFIPGVALIGGMFTVFVVFKIASIGEVLPITTLILSGVALGSLFSAGTSLILLRADGQIYSALAFLLGGSLVSGWQPILASLPFLMFGTILLFISGHALNVLQFGEAQAVQLGINVKHVKIKVVIGATICTAVSVAFTGVIGFVGLVVPHLVRIFFGADYKYILLFSFVGGGIFLLWVDLIARTIIAPTYLPLGIVTSFVGAPFFLWILRRAKKEVFW